MMEHHFILKMITDTFCFHNFPRMASKFQFCYFLSFSVDFPGLGINHDSLYCWFISLYTVGITWGSFRRPSFFDFPIGKLCFSSSNMPTAGCPLWYNSGGVNFRGL